MKKGLLIILTIVSYVTPLSTQEPSSPIVQPTGGGALFSAREASAFAIMGWGFGLAIGIAALCALIPDSTSSSH